MIIKIKASLIVLILIASLFALSIVIFGKAVEAQEVRYCCEKTNSGFWCQNSEAENCNTQYQQTATSCEATSFCRLGCCYDSTEGTCMENTPQRVCDESGGTWTEGAECNVPQCESGCCILGTQAAFVTLTRCKKLSSFYGLETNFRRDIASELNCIATASLGDEGACVFEVDYGGKTCEFTSRQECNSIQEGNNVGGESSEFLSSLFGSEEGTVTGNVKFYKDLLCSAEELDTDCGPSRETTCAEGKDEVYFVDTCGNVANIYDASKVNDKDYWRKKVSKEDSCNSNKPNINSRNCGNCNYFSGSICSRTESGNRAAIGDYMCKDLDCHDTSDGEKRHGESWCSTDKYRDSPGSRYFRHLCMNGEEIVEPCADFRNERCIEDDINGFSQAACRVNRWQDCYSQTEKSKCENLDKRDCIWTIESEEVQYQTSEEGVKTPVELGCVPKYAPGFDFWTEGDAQGICSRANKQCVVVYEKGLLGGEKCVENCECLDESWKQEQLAKCGQLGDCGSKVNYIGKQGSDEGYKIKTEKVDEEGNVVEEEESEDKGILGFNIILDKFGLNKDGN